MRLVLIKEEGPRVESPGGGWEGSWTRFLQSGGWVMTGGERRGWEQSGANEGGGAIDFVPKGGVMGRRGMCCWSAPKWVGQKVMKWK